MFPRDRSSSIVVGSRIVSRERVSVRPVLAHLYHCEIVSTVPPYRIVILWVRSLSLESAIVVLEELRSRVTIAGTRGLRRVTAGLERLLIIQRSGRRERNLRAASGIEEAAAESGISRRDPRAPTIHRGVRRKLCAARPPESKKLRLRGFCFFFKLLRSYLFVSVGLVFLREVSWSK